MNFVSLEKLNELRFKSDPVDPAKLQRWCRKQKIPAKKLGGEWRVDLDAFDKINTDQSVSNSTQMILDRIRRAG